MVIGKHIITSDLNVRVCVQLGATLPYPAKHDGLKYLKPVVGLELDVPANTNSEEFMNDVEAFLLDKLSEYASDLNEWSKQA